MANIYLALKANGNDIPGDSTRAQFPNHIEVTSFDWAVITAREAGSGMATGRRVYRDLRIVVPHQKSSVLIWKALTENHVMEGTLKCVRPSPTGDGTEETYLTIRFRQGRVATFSQAQEEGVATEEITFVFHTFEVTHTNGGVTHEDTWSEQR